MNKDKMICTLYAKYESGIQLNATVELLAMALFRDVEVDTHLRWYMQSHHQREYYRKMAQGQLELP